MLRIYPVCLEMLKAVSKRADQIAVHDREHAKQLKESALSVVLNVGEGSGSRGGTRRTKYEYALGSAEESVVNLEAAHAIGYIGEMDPVLREQFNHIIGTLVRNVR